MSTEDPSNEKGSQPENPGAEEAHNDAPTSDDKNPTKKDEEEEDPYDEKADRKVQLVFDKQKKRASLQLGHVLIDYDEYQEREENGVKLYWNMRRTAQKPCNCCLQLCGVWVLLIVVLGIAMATVGTIEFALEVPFYDRAEINQQREDAFDAMARDANFLSTINSGGGEECVHDDPTILTRNGTLVRGPMPSASCQRSSSHFLRLIYLSSDGSNILTEDKLRAIQEVEDRFLGELELTRNCYLIDSTYPAFENRDIDDIAATISSTVNNDPEFVACERINSVLNFLDPLYFDRFDNSGLGYYLIPNDQVPQEYNYSSLNDVVSFWSNFSFQTYDFSNFDFAVAAIGGGVTIRNLFWRVTSSDFTVGSTEAAGVTSTYSLGLPIDGYYSSTEKADDQFSDIGQWLWDTYDSYLKGVDIDGVDLYWGDSEGGMENAEGGYLAMRSFIFFPFSLFIVLLYLMYMQDSMFLGLMGVMQILLSFAPVLLVYRYVIGQEYIGVLQLIAVYVILGIGMDNIFVFCDQFHHQKHEKEFDVRMQKTFNIASRAMFTTSCTTFISFISTASSVFPAVSTFGIFAALLVLMNFIAVITFFPAVYAVYHTRIRFYWWDHPSLLLCCKRDGLEEELKNKPAAEEGEESKEEDELNKEGDETVAAEAEGESEEKEAALVTFFRDTWAPLMVKLRYPILIFYLAIFIAAVVGTTQLNPDEGAPNTLPSGNNYKEYPEKLLQYFARAGNPRAIEVRWVSGIDPDVPLDRTGTDDTNVTDYGEPQFLDCSTYNPATPAAQVWSLQTCHDVFFGNVSDFHGDETQSFGSSGIYGPRSRLVVSDNVASNEYSYYSVVSCPMQSFRDWMLTDTGCDSLQSFGLPCYNETASRSGCTTWDLEGNSCEPFPAPEESMLYLFVAFLQDNTTDPLTQETNYDKFKDQVFAADNVEFDEETIVKDDFLCRAGDDGTVDENKVIYGMATLITLDQDFAQSYNDGIELFEKWDAWSKQMRTTVPREMVGTMQISSGAWAFYFLNETLLAETFSSIALALGLSFIILTVVGGNIILAAIAVFTIILIVIDVFAFTVIAGWSLGVIEAVNYVVVIGMSIDYAVHMSAAYKDAQAETRNERVALMLEEMGVSVLSGALSTLLAIFLMFFAPNFFFVKFASFLFVTIALSCIYSMTFFPAILSLIGPLGDTGDIYKGLRKLAKRIFHEMSKNYILSKEFFEHETKLLEEDMMKQQNEPSEAMA